MRLRDFHYHGRIIGQVNSPATQSDGIYVKTVPRRHLNPDEVEVLVLCLLDGYVYKIGPSGEVYLKLPRNTKYGPILRGIAKAYFLLQTVGFEALEEGRLNGENRGDP